MKKVYVFKGDGIECEQESVAMFRALQSEYSFEVEECFFHEVWEVRAREKKFEKRGEKNLAFFPGGFSFADHFGAGTLAAFKIQKTGLFDFLLKQKFSFWGVCNGFQILMKLGLFGDEWSLQHNARQQGFVNRWVNCEMKGQAWRMTVRHGEGLLSCRSGVDQSSKLQTEIFLKYKDYSFNNGSFENAAGLKSILPQGNRVVGMMPHPEVLRSDANALKYSRQILEWSFYE